jgi:DNA integrity scanning protein DisA with diadenylate cyclase activity
VWVHLRLCLVCGHVGCCDDSQNKHATSHYELTGHPVIESLEPEEDWRWCFIDKITFPGRSDIRNAFEKKSRGPVVSANEKSAPISANNGHLRGRSTNGMFKSICQRVRKCKKRALEPTIELAVEIAREGREGRRIGTLFTFGDADAVLARSRPLILDPLAGHPNESKTVTDPNLRGTVKELAQLDGAFVISDTGIVLSACRYLDAVASEVTVPFGMASRHLAGASISKETDAIAIVVSESSMVRVFDDGKLIAEIIPELWIMDYYNVNISAPFKEEHIGDMAVLTAKR